MNAPIPILKLTRIGKTFPGVTALDGIEFELLPGEVHVLLGENGAGKSTLAKILSGACQKSCGEIWLDGRPIEIRNPRHARDLGIAMIYQELNLARNLTVAQNLFLGRESCVFPGVIRDGAVRAAAQEILDGLGVKVSVERKAGELGIAQQQMVEIARALSLNARVLIMDEPTSALSGPEVRELFGVIARLKATGVAIIYISHRLEELIEIGDRVTVLRDGRSVVTLDMKQATRAELVRLMVNRELKEQFPKKTASRGDEVLRVEGLSQKNYLRNVSFSVWRGEVLGIAGLMGSGRSRLARALFGVEEIDAGTISVQGRPCRVNSPRRAIDLGIGYLAEDRRAHGLVLNLSVSENICLSCLDRFCRWGMILRGRQREAVDDNIRRLRIKTPGSGQAVMFLSGGNQQKVVLSKWLCSKAQLFIFDEPTRGVDVGAKVEIYELINSLTAAGAAVILISSELPEVLGMSDRILTMRHGSISGEFSVADASQEKVLQAALGMN